MSSLFDVILSCPETLGLSSCSQSLTEDLLGSNITTLKLQWFLICEKLSMITIKEKFLNKERDGHHLTVRRIQIQWPVCHSGNHILTQKILDFFPGSSIVWGGQEILPFSYSFLVSFTRWNFDKKRYTSPKANMLGHSWRNWKSILYLPINLRRSSQPHLVRPCQTNWENSQNLLLYKTLSVQMSSSFWPEAAFFASNSIQDGVWYGTKSAIMGANVNNNQLHPTKR